MKPECEEIEELARQNYTVIPVCKEIYADVITPITLLRKIAARSDRHFLLESVEGGEKWGRYSFLGFDPSLRVYAKKGLVTIEEKGVRDRRKETSDPLGVLRDILKNYRSPKIKGLPPFTGGFVGYFGYAMMEYAEPELRMKRGDFNDYDVCLYDRVIAYDSLKQKIYIIVNMKTDSIMKNYGKAAADIMAIESMIKDTEMLPEEKADPREAPTEFSCSVSREEYCDMVNRTKEHIYAGDIFQGVISRQFSAEYHRSLLNAYRVLRTTNPSPYMVYMHVDDEEIISTSPETLIRLQDGRLTTFPVAGSRPRGSSEAGDKALADDLLADEKELAEHNMLVDLGRNDLGRISAIGSVEVTKYMVLHKYSKIMHLCSQVESNILEDKDAFDAIASLLPAGTLSGAPKIRACQIIEETERVPRGIYGGALGYVDFTGNMDTCIAIRMAVKKNGTVRIQAGAGIVADSVPESEYLESYSKALAVINAVKNAGEVNS